MRISKRAVARWMGAGTLGGFLFLYGAGCQTSQKVPLGASEQTLPGEEQLTFDSPEAASQALQDAVSTPEKDDMHRLFGNAIGELVSGDPVEDKNSYQAFARKAKEKVRIEKKTDALAELYIGQEDWPFAIPLVKAENEKWFFDTEAGKTEILARRIGKNELETIATVHAYVQAQREYAGKDRDGSEVLKYAQRLVSRAGQKDGLYWTPTNADDQSPFGPLAADAGLEGYSPLSGSRKVPTPYHGYYFHILKAQGSAAPGGDYNYVINGNMIAGFALVAAPAECGQSGIMTFIVNHQGKVYQKDLGPKTRSIFQSMTKYDPDPSWALVKE